MALLGATTPGQSKPGSNGNEGVLRIPQSSSIIGSLPSDCLVSYTEHSLGGRFYPSAEVQSVYSTVPAEWASWLVIFSYNYLVKNIISYTKPYNYEQINDYY